MEIVVERNDNAIVKKTERQGKEKQVQLMLHRN